MKNDTAAEKLNNNFINSNFLRVDEDTCDTNHFNGCCIPQKATIGIGKCRVYSFI